MRLTFSKASTPKKIVEALKESIKDVNVRVYEDRVELRAMDNTFEVLVELVLMHSNKLTIECNSTSILGINMDQFSKIMRIFDNESEMCLEYDNSDTILMREVDDNELTLASVNVKLLRIEENIFSIQDTDFMFSVTIPTSLFCKIFRDLKELGDLVVIVITEQTIQFNVDGFDIAGSVSLSKSDNITILYDNQYEDNTVSKTFGMKCIVRCCKSSPLCEFVTISMSIVGPLFINFILGQEDHLKYYVTPKSDS